MPFYTINILIFDVSYMFIVYMYSFMQYIDINKIDLRIQVSKFQ